MNSKSATADDDLWRTIRAEVEQVSRDEPELSSYFYAAILSHGKLESALAYCLAELLAGDSVTTQTMRQVIELAFAADPGISARMRRDLVAYFDRDPASDKYYMPLLYFKGFQALQAHRVGHWYWCNGRRSLALFIQGRVSAVFAVDIHPAARIGGGIMIDHATGLVVGETAIIEDDVSILHSVTLGGSGSGGGHRHPTIRRGVLISAGAKILGNIEVGEGAKIGAGSLVVESVPPHTTVVGVPARRVGQALKTIPALEMDHRINNANGDMTDDSALDGIDQGHGRGTDK